MLNRDKQYAQNIRNERRACARVFNAARREIIAAANKVDDRLQWGAGWLCAAACPVSPAQEFGDYNRDGRDSLDLELVVRELESLASDVSAVDESARDMMEAAVGALKSFDVWYGALCRRDWTPAFDKSNALEFKIGLIPFRC